MELVSEWHASMSALEREVFFFLARRWKESLTGGILSVDVVWDQESGAREFPFKGVKRPQLSLDSCLGQGKRGF